MTTFPHDSQHPARRISRVAGLALAALALTLAIAGCRTDAQDRNYHFNNPLDPNIDTGTGTGTGTGQLVIVYVDSLSDIVVIGNTGVEDTAMDSWVLQNATVSGQPGFASYTFTGFTLARGQLVRVHSAVAPSGGDTSTDVYAGSSTPNWGPSAPDNSAILYNASNVAIFRCTIGDPCWP